MSPVQEAGRGTGRTPRAPVPLRSGPSCFLWTPCSTARRSKSRPPQWSGGYAAETGARRVPKGRTVCMLIRLRETTCHHWVPVPLSILPPLPFSPLQEQEGGSPQLRVYSDEPSPAAQAFLPCPSLDSFLFLNCGAFWIHRNVQNSIMKAPCPIPGVSAYPHSALPLAPAPPTVHASSFPRSH